MPSARPPESPDWITASEIAEHAYCPRAAWYSRHPGEQIPGALSPQDLERQRKGRKTHERIERQHEASRGSSGWVWLLMSLVSLGLLLWLLVQTGVRP